MCVQNAEQISIFTPRISPVFLAIRPVKDDSSQDRYGSVGTAQTVKTADDAITRMVIAKSANGDFTSMIVVQPTA